MSHVDNVFVFIESCNCEYWIEEINKRVKEIANGQQFKLITDVGGSKELEADVLVAAFNYGPSMAQLTEMIREIPVDYLDDPIIQVGFKGQSNYGFIFNTVVSR